MSLAVNGWSMMISPSSMASSSVASLVSTVISEPSVVIFVTFLRRPLGVSSVTPLINHITGLERLEIRGILFKVSTLPSSETDERFCAVESSITFMLGGIVGSTAEVAYMLVSPDTARRIRIAFPTSSFPPAAHLRGVLARYLRFRGDFQFYFLPIRRGFCSYRRNTDISSFCNRDRKGLFGEFRFNGMLFGYVREGIYIYRPLCDPVHGQHLLFDIPCSGYRELQVLAIAYRNTSRWANRSACFWRSRGRDSD